MKEYYINSIVTSKEVFFKWLRVDCRKVVDTDVVAGWCGVDICDFDKKKYSQMLRKLRKGEIVMFLDSGRVYKTLGA